MLVPQSEVEEMDADVRLRINASSPLWIEHPHPPAREDRGMEKGFVMALRRAAPTPGDPDPLPVG